MRGHVGTHGLGRENFLRFWPRSPYQPLNPARKPSRAIFLRILFPSSLALEAGYQTNEKPVTAELVKTVRSRQFDDLEPTLARHGYWLKDMTEQLAKAAKIRAMFSNQLEPRQTDELRERMLAAGISI